MNIQSLSIVVPTGQCWNHCEFCVSRMHSEDYGKNLHFDIIIPEDYINRMEYVREEGCNSMIITGTAEPQQNLPFIYKLLAANRTLRKPFYNIAIQTTGSGLNSTDICTLATSGVTTLALSVNSFDDIENWEITNTPANKRIMTIEQLIEEAKKWNMNVRVCLNLTSAFNGFDPTFFFFWAEVKNVDQLTFRKIYKSGTGKEAEWVGTHEYPRAKFKAIEELVRTYGVPIAKLPYGFVQYSVNGISTVIDTNCMSKDNIDEMKYAILRPNGHLYSRWDDKGSLIF